MNSVFRVVTVAVVDCTLLWSPVGFLLEVFARLLSLRPRFSRALVLDSPLAKTSDYQLGRRC